MLKIFTKDDESKYDFLSVKEFILVILLCLFVVIILPGVIMGFYKPFEFFIITNLYLLFALPASIYVIYYFCCKKKNKTFREGLFIINKSNKVYKNSFIIGVLMPIITSPILFFASPQNFYAKEQLEGGHLIGLVIAGLLLPLFEEVIFRGFLFSYIQTKLNSFWAIALSGALFGLAHVSNVGNVYLMLTLFVFYGLVISYIRYQTKSIIPTIITHATHNLTLIVGFVLIGLIKG